MNKFILDKIEVRSIETEIGKKVVVKGYAVAKDIPHIYKYVKDGDGKVIQSFKSLFTENAIRSMENQMKHKRVFIDELHSTASFLNSKSIIENIKDKVDDDLKQQLESLESQLALKELPLFKPISFDVLDDGLFVEVESNPHFATLDDNHKRYYDAIMNSILDKYLNGFSINFKTKDVVYEDGLEKINDVDFFGISIVPDASLGATSGITEVAVRSIIEMRSEKMETEKVVNKEEIDKMVAEMVAKRLEEENNRKLESERHAAMEKDKAEQEKLINGLKQQMEELKNQQSGSKGNVPNTPQPQMDYEKLKQKINELSFKELMTLKAEFGDKFPAYTIGTVASKGRDPSFKMVLEPLDGSMQQLHEFHSRKQTSDMVMPKERF